MGAHRLIASADSGSMAHLAAVGTDALSSSPQQFAAHIKAEIAKWGKVVKAAGMVEPGK